VICPDFIIDFCHRVDKKDYPDQLQKMLFDELQLAISPNHSTKQVTLSNGIGVAVCKMMGIDFWAQFQRGVEF
jgi:hypothetical protein